MEKNISPIEQRSNVLRRRRGTTLVEATAALFLLTVLSTSLVEGLLALQTNDAALHRRQIAQLEVANELQRVAALRWKEIVALPSGPTDISAEVRKMLGDVRITTSVEPVADEPAARKIRVELQWPSISGERTEPPMRLTAWVYQQGRRASP